MRTLLVATISVLAIMAPAHPPAGLPREDAGGLLSINGTKIFHRILGKGTPLVLVHGGPGLDHSYFLPQMAPLARRCKLIFYDQRASGKSSMNVDTATMTMDSFVEDLEGVRTTLQLGKMNLLGHSWGGLVALFYAIKYPENLNSLILVESSPASHKERDSSFRIMQSFVSRDDSLATALLMKTEGFARREPRAMADFFRLLFRGTFYNRRLADSLTLVFDTTLAKRSALTRHLQKDKRLASYDLYGRLHVVRCPVLIVVGERDMIPAGANEALAGSIRGSELVVLERSGHFPFIEQPERFFGLVSSFLARVSNTQK